AKDHLAGPLGELDLADELRLHVDRAARRLRAAAREGRCLAPQRRQPLLEVVEVALLGAGPDAPGVPQLPVRVVVAHQELADPAFALPLAGEPAADHELLV